MLWALALLCGCGPKVGPSVDPPGSPTGQVGVELQFQIHGTSPDGKVSFDFAAPDLPDLKTRSLPATITNYDQGEAVFRWTPLADDVGRHEIDLEATGNSVTTLVPMVVTVNPGSGSPPVFVEPTGEGTTLELVRGPCADLDVVVEDVDATDITIDLAPPLVDNATLTEIQPGASHLSFCPSDAQVAASTVYPLALTATAGGLTVGKTYTIVVRPIPMVTCTTQPPAITTKPVGDLTTIGDLHVIANISDDLGVAVARLLFSTVAPADPKMPDLGAFSPVELTLGSGTPLAGQYDAYIPNPVVASDSGTVVTIYYALQASDDDPPYGCAHTSLNPKMGVYSFKVTRP
jgi:hypothetical protein